MGENFHRYWTQWETGNPSTANLGLLSDGIEVQVTYQTSYMNTLNKATPTISGYFPQRDAGFNPLYAKDA